MSYPGFAPNHYALDELIRHGQAGHRVTLVWWVLDRRGQDYVYGEELDLAGNNPGTQYYAALISMRKPFGLAEFGQTFY